MSNFNGEARAAINENGNSVEDLGSCRFLYQATVDNLPHWFLQKIRGDHVSSCDWLCAVGGGTDLLAQRLNIRVTGVDVALDLIEAARRTYPKPDFVLADYLDSAERLDHQQFDVLFVIDKLQRYLNPGEILTNVATRARKFIVALVPYREYGRARGHASTFDQGNIPATVGEHFSLVYSRVIDTDKSEHRNAHGEHILLIYVAKEEMTGLGLLLGDIEIGRDSAREGMTLQGLRRELKAANQLFLDHTFALEQRLGAREAELRERDQTLYQRDHVIAALQQSTSWRLTSPLRDISQAARKWRELTGSIARVVYRKTPLPIRWKQAAKRALLGGDAGLPTVGAVTSPEAVVASPGVPEGKLAVAPRFVPPLRGPQSRADVFVWGLVDWHSPESRSQHIARGMASLGHRTYYFSSRFADDAKSGFRIEPISEDGLLNVVYLNVSNPRSISDLVGASAMAESLRASLSTFLVQVAPTSIISLLQHPFWLPYADGVPNRHLIYEMLGDRQSLGGAESGLYQLDAQAIREADLVLAASDSLARSGREQGGVVLVLQDEENSKPISADERSASAYTWTGQARIISQRVDQHVAPLVSLVLVTYNKLDLTDACLRSLEKNTHYKNFEVIVVDNDSRDATPAYLAEWARRGENRRIILNPDNRGFAAGNNQGLHIARGEYLVLLNNDTYVTPGWLGTLIRHLKRNPTIGIVGPVTNNIGNEARIDISYDSMDEMECAARLYTAGHMGERLTLYTAAFFCVAFTREIYQKVGDLDEMFGIGMFEDDDYCRRVQQLGYTIACAEDVFIHHHHSASFNLMGMERKVKLFTENRKLYESKWGPWVSHGYREGFGRKH